jgi:hypothetical protein
MPQRGSRTDKLATGFFKRAEGGHKPLDYKHCWHKGKSYRKIKKNAIHLVELIMKLKIRCLKIQAILLL